jgi:AcrR family transcriptional regulator
VAALSLHALATRAGVSSGAPYHHFESREQLLVAIAEQGFELLASEMARAADEAKGDAAAHLRALGLGYIRFALAHRGHFRVMFRPELQAGLASTAAPGGGAFTMLQEAVLRCQCEGLAPKGDPTPLVLVAWSCVHGASSLWIDGSLGHKRLVQSEEELATMISSTIVQLFVGR